MTEMKALELGSISHGTLRDCDLAEAVAYALRSVEHDDSELLDLLDSIAAEEEIEDAGEVVNNGIDALGGYAPPFCYVGMHEGDGSDLGVWFMHDSFEEACRDGEVLKIGGSSEIDDMDPAVVAAYEYIAIVSDHGNVTLYRPRVTLGEEVLSLV
jgi:hypothetical protein